MSPRTVKRDVAKVAKLRTDLWASYGVCCSKFLVLDELTAPVLRAAQGG